MDDPNISPRKSLESGQPSSVPDLNRGWVVIDTVGGTLEVDDEILEQARSLFERAERGDLLWGRTVLPTAGACLHAARHCDRRPSSIERLASVSPPPEDDIREAYSQLNTELQLPVPPLRPEDHLPELADRLDIDETIRSAASDLIQTARDEGLVANRAAEGIAAAGLIVAASSHGADIERKEVLSVISVSDATFDTRRRELRTLETDAAED
jgi:transcription initiation factor TFIIB